MQILLPVDGSDGALEAVRHGVRLLHDGLRVRFVLANVQEPASFYEVVVAHDAQVLEEVSAAAAEHSLSAAQALLRAAGAEFEIEAVSGDPGHMLIDIVERFGCDMVVMGARGVGAPQSRTALGSVATAVLHAAAVPVTIVRAED